MPYRSILLALDGSAQCLQAVELLSQQFAHSQVKIDAQYVIDSPGIWEFLNYDLPGLIGSGPYLKAHEAMKSELLALGQTLIEMYEVRADSQGLTGSTFLDEGNPVRELCRRAADHDLVVVGHRSTDISSAGSDRRRLPRFSLAEKLLYACDRPLLVIQSHCEPWSNISLIVEDNKDFKNALHGCFELAALLSLDVSVLSVGIRAGSALARVSTVLNNYQKQFPQVPADVTCIGMDVVESLLNGDKPETSLLVLPTSLNGDLREGATGMPVDQIIRYSSLSSALFWPSEFCLSNKSETVNSISQPVP